MTDRFNPAKPQWRNRAQYMGHGANWHVGNKSECAVYVKGRSNRHWLPWTGVPRPEERGAIERLWLRPTPKQIEKQELPPYLSELTQTSFLAVPIALLPTLTPSRLPPGLVTLWLDVAEGFTDDGKALPRWPEDLVLPQIRGLVLGEHGNARFQFRQGAEWHELGLRGRNLPGLEYLLASIDVEQRAVEELAEFGELLHLELFNVQAIERVFEVASTTLEHLFIEGRVNLDFSGAGVARLSRLRSLNFNLNLDVRDNSASACEVDCRHFREVPELEELTLAGVTRYAHVEALLECPRLQWLGLILHGDPLPDQLKAKFEAHGFRGLHIWDG